MRTSEIFFVLFIYVSVSCTIPAFGYAAQSPQNDPAIIPAVNLLLNSQKLLPVELIKTTYENEVVLDSAGRTLVDSESFGEDISLGIDGSALNGVTVNYVQVDGVIFLQLNHPSGLYAPKLVRLDMLNIPADSVSLGDPVAGNKIPEPAVYFVFTTSIVVYYGFIGVSIAFTLWTAYDVLAGFVEIVDFNLEHIKSADYNKIVWEGTVREWAEYYATIADTGVGILALGLSAYSFGLSSITLKGTKAGCYHMAKEVGVDIVVKIIPKIIDYVFYKTGKIIGENQIIEMTIYRANAGPFLRIEKGEDTYEFKYIYEIRVVETLTVISNTGRVWMDRNLGASRVATSPTDIEAYGDLYQWGRLADGHEKRISSTTSTLSVDDIPGHGSFILESDSPYDWRIPQNANLWQGVSGINNPCPAGFRLPTSTELEIERVSWGSYDEVGAYASPLKLVVAGFRYHDNGTIYYAGSYGIYWSSTVNGSYSRYLLFYSGRAGMYSNGRAYGFSVRCLKD